MRNFPNEPFLKRYQSWRCDQQFLLKPARPPSCSMLKYQHPPVFKQFVVNFVRFLTIEDRAAFKHWCIDLVSGSKLDVDVANDGDIFKLIEFLLCARELSFTDMSLLNEFLSSVGSLEGFSSLKDMRQ